MLDDPLRRDARGVHRAQPRGVVRPAERRGDDSNRRHEALCDDARLEEAVVGVQLASDRVAVVFALAVQMLRLRIPSETVHGHHPEVIEDSAGDVLRDFEPQLDLEAQRVQVDYLEGGKPRVRRHEHAFRRPVQHDEHEPDEPSGRTPHEVRRLVPRVASLAVELDVRFRPAVRPPRKCRAAGPSSRRSAGVRDAPARLPARGRRPRST